MYASRPGISGYEFSGSNVTSAQSRSFEGARLLQMPTNELGHLEHADLFFPTEDRFQLVVGIDHGPLFLILQPTAFDVTGADRSCLSREQLKSFIACQVSALWKGKEDTRPSPSDVAEIEEELKRLGKKYEFHSYEKAGHGFFAVDRPGYRPEAAMDGWKKVFNWFGKYLS